MLRINELFKTSRFQIISLQARTEKRREYLPIRPKNSLFRTEMLQKRGL